MSKDCSQQSQLPDFQLFADGQLPVHTLLHLATLGGAQVCCLDDKVGNFEEGKYFDALVVDIGSGHGNPGLWGLHGEEGEGEAVLEGMLERFLFCGDDRNIKRVYVQGRFVGGREFGKWKH
jgi:guanine deaminase